jgi:tRNA/rRNA methyltransferase
MADLALDRIRIVLVEPAGDRNVGAIARVMKNMGLHRLILVSPHCDPFSRDAQHMAVHAKDILARATCVDTLPEALAGCQRAIATTARERSLCAVLEPPRVALPWLLETPAALIFGPEDRGLSNEELNYAQRFVRIPSSDAYPSLNLAQSVGICCYELFAAFTQPPVARTDALPPPPDPEAPLERLEGYYQHLEQVLLKIGYLYPHTAASRMEKFRRLYSRARPSDTEVAMLRGILRQVEWALSQSSTVGDPLNSPGESLQSDEA